MLNWVKRLFCPNDSAPIEDAPTKASDLLIGIFDDPQYRDEYGIPTHDAEAAVDRLAVEFGWRGLTSGLIHILEQDSLRGHWYDATAGLFWLQLDNHLELPRERTYLVAVLYDCLLRDPTLGSREDEGQCENLVWSIVHELMGVGYLSDYDPMKDPEVLKHEIARQMGGPVNSARPQGESPSA